MRYAVILIATLSCVCTANFASEDHDQWTLSLRAYVHELPTEVEQTRFRVTSSLTGTRITTTSSNAEDYDEALRGGVELAFQRRLGDAVGWISGLGVALSEQNIDLLGLNFDEQKQLDQLSAIQAGDVVAFTNANLATQDVHELRSNALGALFHSGLAIHVRPVRFEISGIAGAGGIRTRTHFRATRYFPGLSTGNNLPLVLQFENRSSTKNGVYWEGGARAGAFISIQQFDIGLIGGWLYRQEWYRIESNNLALNASNPLNFFTSETGVLRLTSDGFWAGVMGGFTF